MEFISNLGNFAGNVAIIILLIVVLVLVHEFGHFIVAKLSGMLVREFSIGMGPVLFSFTYGETQYSIRAFPIGGFVDILGESCEQDDGEKCDKTAKDNPRSFINKPVWQRLLVIAAGVTMNFFLAVGLFYVLLFANDFALPFANEGYEYTPPFGSIERVRFSDLGYSSLDESGGAAAAAMPESGYITQVAGKGISGYEDLQSVLQDRAGKNSIIEVCDDSPYYYDWAEKNDIMVDREARASISCEEYIVEVSDDGRIGVILNLNNSYNEVSYRGVEKALGGFAHSVNFFDYTFFIVPRFIGSYIEQGDYESVAVQSVSSPIAIYFVVDQLKEGGWEPIVQIGAMMSLSLAFVNLLPIPALDGGRILLLMIEAIFKRPLNRKLEGAIVKFSFYFLLILMVLVVLKDIVFIRVLQNLFK